MRTLKKVPVQLVEVEYIPMARDMVFGIIYYSKQYRTCNHLCVCGCGQQTPLPIYEEEWHLDNENGKVTITPSIAHRLGCKSHYIITNGVANLV